MSLLLAVLVVVAFAVALEALGLPERAREVVRRSGECVHLLRDPSLDDAERERGLQRQAVRLFGLLGILAGGAALALGVPLAAVWLLERAGVASLPGVLEVLERVDFLLAACVVGGAAYFLARRMGSGGS